MKCPLFMAGIFTHQKLYGKADADCIKEECERFDKDAKCCGEVSERIALEKIAEALERIADQMPKRF